MPELPEVETVCRSLQRLAAGQGIASVDLRARGLRAPFARGFAKQIAGARILSVKRRAKYILVSLDNGRMLVLHLGMSGRLVVEPQGYRPVKHDHILFHLGDGRVIVFNDPRRFGAAFTVKERDWEQHPVFCNLGLEPLSRGFTGAALTAVLRGRKAPVKTVLMDQKLIVGIGNIYASEALFLAGISPLRPAGQIKAPEAARLEGAIRTVLRAAIRAGGSTLRDYRDAGGEKGVYQDRFGVYGRAGKACPGCACDIGKTAGIRCVTQAGRSTFYCPVKQK